MIIKINNYFNAFIDHSPTKKEFRWLMVIIHAMIDATDLELDNEERIAAQEWFSSPDFRAVAQAAIDATDLELDNEERIATQKWFSFPDYTVVTGVDHDPMPEESMWLMVIIQAIIDATDLELEDEERIAAQEWFLSPDFREVADLADLEPERTFHKALRIINNINLKNNAKRKNDSNSGKDIGDNQPQQRFHKTSERAMQIIHSLQEREKNVMLRRYGLDGFLPSTLEKVAKEFFVTRERVRQVESGAIRHLRISKNTACFRDLLDSAVMELWADLSNDTGFIPAKGLDTEAIRSNGLLRLALDVVHNGVHEWLKATGRPVLGGWLKNDIPADEFRSDVRLMVELAREGLFPMPIEKAGKTTGMDVQRVCRAIRLVSELRIFDGHLVKGHLGAQAKRTVRFYKILQASQRRRLIDFRIHLTKYEHQFPEDGCILRIAELTMERAPHLFKKVFDNFWFAVPPPEIPMDESDASVLDDVPILYADPQDEEDPGTDSTVRQWLADLLDARGPMRFYDIKTEGVESLPVGISINSLGPVLQTAGEFMRLAPGVYGLPKHLASVRNAGARYPSSMMTEEQCRWYAMARKAGEPMSLFPAWDYRFERALCYLAMGHCSSELYGSLLAVSDPSRWNCPHDELEEWHWLKKKHGRYQLDVPCRHPLDPGKVTPDQLLSALLLMRATGSMSWISLNRAGLKRIDSHKCASGLALLVALGAIQSATHWQDRHLPGPEADRILEILSGELASKGNLSWKSGEARALLIAASTAIPTSGKGWIDGWEYKEFMDRLLNDCSKDGEKNDAGESELDGIISEQGWAQEWKNEEPPGNDASQADSDDDLFLGDDWGKQWQE